MNNQEAIEVLSEYNKWRTSKPPYDDCENSILRYTPREITKAIDIAINELRKTIAGPELNPLHVRLIRCITPNAKCNTPRDEAEMRAWNKVKSWVKEKHVETIEQFYKAKKSENADETWKRKHGVSALLNQFGEQIDLADSFLFKNKPVFQAKNEPQGWKIAADCIANQLDCAPELRKELTLAKSWDKVLPHVQSIILEQLNRK